MRAKITVFEDFKKKYHVLANEQQEKAILKINGATLLLAVPGSGKTSVIIGRVGYMVKCMNIAPESILTLTFTRAAANEMKERYIRKFHLDELEIVPDFSTINSFCYKILRRCEKVYGVVLPEMVSDRMKIVRDVLLNMTNEFPQESTIRNADQIISYIKNMMLDKDSNKELKSPDFKVPDMYNRYTEMMSEKNFMDYDDQLILAYEFLNRFPELLEKIQNHYKYINVDEAQDTSYIQHEIINLLASRNQNIFMVGDEDQSIYMFRGAYPDALLNFQRVYLNAEVLYMESNFRSTVAIVNAANDFIKQNKDRHDKNMFTKNEQGNSIQVSYVPDVSEQFDYLLRVMQKKQGSIAVLYRNNESGIPLLNLLDLKEIPFNIRDGSMDLFFSHFVVKDIMAYLTFSLYPSDIDAFAQIYYKLGAYLSKKNYEQIKTIIIANPHMKIIDVIEMMPQLSAGNIAKARMVTHVLNGIRTIKPQNAISAILYRANYIDWINLKVEEGCSEQVLLQKINTLLALGNEFNNIDDYLNRLHMLAEYKQPMTAKKPNITLSTMHSSKGLEFDNVYIIDAFEGILPSETSVSNMITGNRKEYDEEVRLFYVAATRARKFLEYIVSKKRFKNDVVVSRFVSQFSSQRTVRHIPGVKKTEAKSTRDKTGKQMKTTVTPDCFTVGSELHHTTFGKGTVTGYDGVILKMKFQNGAVKSFVASACIEKGFLHRVEDRER